MSPSTNIIEAILYWEKVLALTKVPSNFLPTRQPS